jgi:DNA-binding transcriptional ArsR family regulator
MVNNQTREVDLLFLALSDATRRSILARLVAEELSVGEIAKPYDMSLAGVSKHIKVLEEANIVKKTKSGRSYRCRANLDPLDRVTEVLEGLGLYWRNQLDSLENFLSDDKKELKEK